ncbi:Hydroxyacid oxidase 1 [Branchiostoma belcheri]|nr:Hydroxyacid oxidase 1 [Branchiostoma belcheri]
MASKFVCLADFEKFACESLDKNALNYYNSGANNEQTLRDNVDAFRRYRLRPRFLRDVSRRDTTTTVLGELLDFPVALAPTAMQRMAHPDGEVATARAAASMNTGMILSSWATSTIEEVAEASAGGLRWFQLYVYKDRQVTRNLVERAEKAGYKAIFLTVDTPILGKRLEDTRNKFKLPAHLRLANFSEGDVRSSGVQSDSDSGLAAYVASLIDPSLSWEHVDWLRSVTKLPIILKGVLTAEVAREAVEHGIDGILVSNHGARQLDGVPATIDALREVVSAVNGQVEVYLDGGVRTGTDVLKALALGARCVFVGRPVLWGLAYKGQEGVQEMLQMLREEFSLAMALSGCGRVSDITPALVVHESYYQSSLRHEVIAFTAALPNHTANLEAPTHKCGWDKIQRMVVLGKKFCALVAVAGILGWTMVDCVPLSLLGRAVCRAQCRTLCETDLPQSGNCPDDCDDVTLATGDCVVSNCSGAHQCIPVGNGTVAEDPSFVVTAYRSTAESVRVSWSAEDAGTNPPAHPSTVYVVFVQQGDGEWLQVNQVRYRCAGRNSGAPVTCFHLLMVWAEVAPATGVCDPIPTTQGSVVLEVMATLPSHHPGATSNPQLRLFPTTIRQSDRLNTTSSLLTAKGLPACHRYHLQVAAVGQRGLQRLSPVVYLDSSVTDLTIGTVMFDGSRFQAAVTWQHPACEFQSLNMFSPVNYPGIQTRCPGRKRPSPAGVNYRYGESSPGVPTPLGLNSPVAGGERQDKSHTTASLQTGLPTLQPYTTCGAAEGTVIVLDLTDCSQIENYTCVPETPGPVQNIRATVIPTTDGIYANLTWDRPNYGTGQISSFLVRWGQCVTVSILSWINDTTANSTIVPGNVQHYLLRELRPNRRYGVQVLALTPYYSENDVNFHIAHVTCFETGGLHVHGTTEVTLSKMRTALLESTLPYGLPVGETIPPSASTSPLPLYIYIVPACIAAILLAVSYCYYRHYKFSSLTKTVDDEAMWKKNIYIAGHHQPADSLDVVKPEPCDRWEIPFSRLTLYETLGRGAFGKVVRGVLMGSVPTHRKASSPIATEKAKSFNVTVAVKMLHELAGECQVQAFLEEIQLMKRVGYHPNVVSLLACCTTGSPICLVVEHMPQGDLLRYLRSKRSQWSVVWRREENVEH